MKNFNPSEYLYTTLFCEENIWHLVKSLIDEGLYEQDISVIFITNKNQKIAIFNQQKAEPGQAVIWDYHVILMATMENSAYIFDFDSRLAFPCPFEYYLKNSFPDNINPDYMSQFRIIPGRHYLQHFYSDRSHMHGVISETQFPKYPAINSNSVDKFCLQQLLDFKTPIEQTLILRQFGLLQKTLSN